MIELAIESGELDVTFVLTLALALSAAVLLALYLLWSKSRAS